MKYKSKKIVTVILIFVFSILICNITFAHSGRTDSNGGHKDNKNKSGLGSYHYHCGGHPAHLHTNGVCPYSSSSSKTTYKSSSSSSSIQSTSSTLYSNNEVKNNAPSIIDAESIKINETIEEIKVGDSKQLSANILPQNTTNKELTWESSNPNIIKVNSTGKITAIGEGKAYITVSTLNKKTDSIKILVVDDKKEEINNTINTETNHDKVTENSSEYTNSLVVAVLLGALVGGGYLGYKKYKKCKK